MRRLVLFVLIAIVAGAPAAHASTVAMGVVVVDTQLAYQGAVGAGTGMVLTPSGVVLTNNHVIEGATRIKVVVPGRPRRAYLADVVGYDRAADVAVLQLRNASNLETVTIAGAAPGVGAPVTAVGNAGGTGRLTTMRGSVTGLNRSITAQVEIGNAERLTKLIKMDAGLVPGDSGGPLLDAARRVVGMDTAASERSSTGYAIPIAQALTIGRQILAGMASAGVHVGPTAWLGVSIATGEPGAAIVGAVPGGPAANAGLVPGDVITAVAGKAVRTADGLGKVVYAQAPGASVTVTYIDASGATQTASVTLGSGPPQ